MSAAVKEAPAEEKPSNNKMEVDNVDEDEDEGKFSLNFDIFITGETD